MLFLRHTPPSSPRAGPRTTKTPLANKFAPPRQQHIGRFSPALAPARPAHMLMTRAQKNIHGRAAQLRRCSRMHTEYISNLVESSLHRGQRCKKAKVLKVGFEPQPDGSEDLRATKTTSWRRTTHSETDSHYIFCSVLRPETVTT